MAMELTGAQKAAILIMSLRDDQAAALLKHMSDESIAKLREAADSLSAYDIGDEERTATLGEFFTKRQSGELSMGDPAGTFRKFLVKAKGEEIARRVYAGEEPSPGAAPRQTTPLEFIESLPEAQILMVLETESPRAIATILSRLSRAKAKAILNTMEGDLKEATVERMLSSEAVPDEVAEEVLLGFKERFEEMGTSAQVVSDEKRAEEMAAVVAALDKESQEKVLGRIRERDPNMADMLERHMFDFNDLVKVDKKSLQELLRRVEVSQLALALKAAPQNVQQHILSNLSERVRERVAEEREMAGRVVLAVVTEAQWEIMKVAKQMYRDGSLAIETGEEQYVE